MGRKCESLGPLQAPGEWRGVLGAPQPRDGALEGWAFCYRLGDFTGSSLKWSP